VVIWVLEWKLNVDLRFVAQSTNCTRYKGSVWLLMPFLWSMYKLKTEDNATVTWVVEIVVSGNR